MLSRTINRIICFVRWKKIPFKVIAFSGMSGSMMSPPVANELGKHLVLVRKTKKGCHSRHRVEFTFSAFPDSYIIIDDFVASGKTAKRVMREMSETFGGSQCKAILCYSKDYVYGEETVKSVPVYYVWQRRYSKCLTLNQK